MSVQQSDSIDQRRLWPAVVLLLSVVLALAGCRSGASDATAQPETNGSPATTVQSSSESTTSAGETPMFPAVVETDAGTVIVESEPTRIVSLSSTHTEVLYVLGAEDRIVGTDLRSDYPAAAQATAKVDAFNFNIEEVAALEPDLVVLAFDTADAVDALATLRIPFLLLGPPSTVDAAMAQILAVGSATGFRPEATQLVMEMSMAIVDLEFSAGAIEPLTFFHEVDETLFSTTSDSFIGDLYSRLGLVNIADGVDPGNPFPQLSQEYIVDQNPDFIFLADAGFGVTPESVAARPGWESIAAVRDGRVVALDSDIAGRWGPRTVLLMAQILEAISAG